MIIQTISNLDSIESVIIGHFSHAWGISIENSEQLARDFKVTHLERLKNCQTFKVESPYVDKVYRDSYYHYFASKHPAYNRNSIRISLFDSVLCEQDFLEDDCQSRLQQSYLGFIILRPTLPQVLGRSTIHPRAVSENLLCCLAEIKATAGPIKLVVKGFPHSSQDSESISCAETTLWSLLEYYSSKYQEYRPILPSDIIRTLANTINERQLPSSGLDITKMAYAIKEFGFAPKVYSETAYNTEFWRLISIYIESGIPLVIGLLSEDYSIGHAVLLVGRAKISEEKITSLTRSDEYSTDDFSHFDFHDIESNFVFQDDNQPCYVEAPLKAPGLNYNETQWQTIRITHIIAPLYKKMYLEAEVARFYFNSIVFNMLDVRKNTSEILTRFFMASSRSFKHYLATQSSLEKELVDVLVRIEMPKFVWIGELSTKELFCDNKVFGMVVIDATEANRFANPLLYALLKDEVILKLNGDDIQRFSIDLQPFNMYTSNLNV